MTVAFPGLTNSSSSALRQTPCPRHIPVLSWLAPSLAQEAIAYDLTVEPPISPSLITMAIRRIWRSFKLLLRNLETWSDDRRAEGRLEELLEAALKLARQNTRPPYHACMDYSLVPHPDLDVYAVLVSTRSLSKPMLRCRYYKQGRWRAWGCLLGGIG